MFWPSAQLATLASATAQNKTVPNCFGANLQKEVYTNNVVAVIDTGIDYVHSDLAANVWSAPAPFTVNIGGVSIICPAGSHGFNAITNVCDPMDDNQHGTHVSGTIGAVGNNDIGVVGMNWHANIMGSKFLDSSGTGTTADAVNAIEFAIQAISYFGMSYANVRVLSNSWGGGGFSQTLLNEIQRAGSNNMLFVAAAGNNGVDIDANPFYPASYNASNVIAVAATDNNDNLAYFSDYGPKTVTLGAPGVNIFSTVLNNNYGYLSGTSMATPHVSGAAMLVLSTCALNTAGLKADIVNNVDVIPSLEGLTVSGGRLNVNKAINMCNQPPNASSNLADLLDPTDRTVDVFSVGADQHVHQFSYSPSSGWHTSDVTVLAGAPLAASQSRVSNVFDTIDGTPDVFYVGIDQHINLLWFTPSSGQWHTTDVTAKTGGELAEIGSPLTSLMDTISGTPDVFYVGVDQHVHLFRFVPSWGWQTTDLTIKTGAPSATSTSNLASLMDSIDGTPDVFYEDSNGHVHILWLNPFTVQWFTIDVTAKAGAPAAASGSNIVGLLDTIDRTPDIFYEDSNGHVRILWYSPGASWYTRDVTAAAGAPVAASGSSIAGLLDTIDGTPDVFYEDSSGHVRILWYSPGSGWYTRDVTATTAAPIAATRSPLAGILDAIDGTPDVFYETTDEHLHILWYSPGSGWYTRDVTASAH